MDNCQESTDKVIGHPDAVLLQFCVEFVNGLVVYAQFSKDFVPEPYRPWRQVIGIRASSNLRLSLEPLLKIHYKIMEIFVIHTRSTSSTAQI